MNTDDTVTSPATAPTDTAVDVATAT